MFATADGQKPVSLNNVLCRQIRPALKAAGLGYLWHGWHGFRRGLATVLHDRGVDDLTIQSIMRHADVSTTRRCYIKRLPKQSIAAMEQFNELVCTKKPPRSSQLEAQAPDMFSKRAQGASDSASALVN